MFLNQPGVQASKGFYHSTKLMPKKRGNSRNWIAILGNKGVICARQKIVEIIKQEDIDGVKRCRIYLDNSIIKTIPIRKRPFQGWRYLKKIGPRGHLRPHNGDL